MKARFVVRLMGSLLLAAAFAAGAAGEARAQTPTGTIRGTVMDENGAPLAGATVVARNAATNFQRGMLTEESGFYNLAGLPPADYVVEFAQLARGTQTQNVRVQIGQTLRLDVALLPEAIQLEGVTAIVERERIIDIDTPEVATNITQAQIENLPQLNRNFLDFAKLAPGLIPSADGNGVSAGGVDAENVNLFIDGASYKNNVLRNGIVGQDASDGNPFPQNAVEEFRVITQNYKAEYQRATGAVITATTKSGTNEWEGSAFFLG